MNKLMKVYKELEREEKETDEIYAFGELEEFLTFLNQKLTTEEAERLVRCLLNDEEILELAEKVKKRN